MTTDKQKQSEKEQHDKWMNDIRHVLSTAQGRRFYWGIMAKCKAFSSSYVGDTNLSYYTSGQRSIGIGMLNELLEASPKTYLQMIDENESRETRIEMKTEETIKDKLRNMTNIDSPSLPNTGAGTSVGGSK